MHQYKSHNFDFLRLETARNSGESVVYIAFLLVSLIKNVLNKQLLFEIGDLTSLNWSVTCPVIKALIRQKVKFGRTMSDDRH